MKRITLWFLSTVSVVVLLFGYDGSGSASSTASPPAVFSSGGSSSSAPTHSGSTAAGSSKSSGSAAPKKAHKSAKKATRTKTKTSTTRTVTGATAQTQWGPVQVQLAVSGGKITKVTVLQYPSGNGRDTEINNYALPILIRETTSQQSAQIDMVSGATVTSTGYLQSLQSAIDKAGV